MAFWRWRKMSWAILIFTALLATATAYSMAVGDSDCGRYAAGTPERGGCEAGEGIGAGLVATLGFCAWFVGFVILAIVWFMTRPSRRLCPRCGTEARKGQTACRRCGLDFAAVTTAGPSGR